MSGLRAFTMPKWGIEMTEGTVAEWMVAEGADFARGDVVTSIETDKITNEYEAEFSARLVRVVVDAGEVRPVGALLAVFADPGASPETAEIDAFVAKYRPGGASASAPEQATPPAPAVAAPPVAAPASAASLRPFAMPKWGIEMTEGTVADWMIAEGADFVRGDVLMLIETDKITNEYEAEFAGRLARIVVPAGRTRAVGELLAVIAEPGATPDPVALDAFVANYRPGGAAAEATPAPAAATAPAPAQPAAIPDSIAISPAARALAGESRADVSTVAGTGRGGRITLQDVIQAGRPAAPARAGSPVAIAPPAELPGVFASPLARRIAGQHGIDLAQLTGTGRRGRISKADVLARIVPSPPPLPAGEPAVTPVATAPEAVPVAASSPVDGVTIVRMTPMRKAIARQLSLSKSTIPHFYLRNSARLDALAALRAQAKRATGEAPSINDYLVRACALALKAHPDVNVQVHGDEIHRFARADIAVAVATDKGLLTPIVRAADAKSVAAISAEVKGLAARARAGRLEAAEFQGGSFSISNLGMFGIEQFDAIINPPQGAILAVGAARQETVAQDHALGFATRVHLSLSCDHRAIDGAVGARFLADLTALIEAPEALTA